MKLTLLLIPLVVAASSTSSSSNPAPTAISNTGCNECRARTNRCKVRCDPISPLSCYKSCECSTALREPLCRRLCGLRCVSK
ncbi:hypothetical protein BKA66DRAFT_461360 [Pyrenochaeta sp. MPI-SDFR-AT-0127]|nr:hypothetical protein BKA66DRAFT_461360 [Pyrenochaeta sp. MPI-SDFR-AT-0127]